MRLKEGLGTHRKCHRPGLSARWVRAAGPAAAQPPRPPPASILVTQRISRLISQRPSTLEEETTLQSFAGHLRSRKWPGQLKKDGDRQNQKSAVRGLLSLFQVSAPPRHLSSTFPSGPRCPTACGRVTRSRDSLGCGEGQSSSVTCFRLLGADIPGSCEEDHALLTPLHLFVCGGAPTAAPGRPPPPHEPQYETAPTWAYAS